MRLICKALFVGVIVSTFACHDAAAPVFRAGYALADIEGRPVPTYLSPIPEAPTVISAFLELETSGEATLIERRREMGIDVTYTTHYTYTITGNQIEFETLPPCPPNAICIGAPKGTITGSALALTMFGVGGAVVYNFQFLAPD